MGEVYLAIDQRLGRQVALKVISDQVVKEGCRLTRFQREASAAASLNHPNICAIYDFGEIDGRPFIAMEYVEGVGLEERILSGPLKIPDVLGIAVQIAEALDEARKKGVVHRDVKASNILLPNGTR